MGNLSGGEHTLKDFGLSPTDLESSCGAHSAPDARQWMVFRVGAQDWLIRRWLQGITQELGAPAALRP
jgi:hypothetical protein